LPGGVLVGPLLIDDRRADAVVGIGDDGDDRFIAKAGTGKLATDVEQPFGSAREPLGLARIMAVYDHGAHVRRNPLKEFLQVGFVGRRRRPRYVGAHGGRLSGWRRLKLGKVVDAVGVVLDEARKGRNATALSLCFVRDVDGPGKAHNAIEIRDTTIAPQVERHLLVVGF